VTRRLGSDEEVEEKGEEGWKREGWKRRRGWEERREQGRSHGLT